MGRWLRGLTTQVRKNKGMNLYCTGEGMANTLYFITKNTLINIVK